MLLRLTLLRQNTIRAILIGVFLLSTTLVTAQNVDTLFAVIPRSELSVLDKTSKLDLLDLYNSNLTAKTENLFGGVTEMTHKDSLSLTLKTSDAGVWNMYILHKANKAYVLTLYSVNASGTATRVRLYDAEWKLLDKQPAMPDFQQFWSDSAMFDNNQFAISQNTAKFLPVRAEYDSARGVLVYNLSIEALSQEEKKRVQKCIHSVETAVFN